MIRPNLDKIFLTICETLAKRASCRRMEVGCVIVRDKRIISSGVNGPNTWDCDELHCDIEKPCEYSVHAEENAIIFANHESLDLRGTTLYCTNQPCLKCANLIIAHGITRVVYVKPYRVLDGLDALKLQPEIETLLIQEYHV